MQRRGRLDVGGLVVVVAAAVAVGWVLRYHVRDNVWPRNFGVVQEGVLYRSGRQTEAMMARLVREHGIRTIVDLGNAPRGSAASGHWDQVAAALGVERYAFGLQGDGTGDPNDYVAALKVIRDPAKRPVLVHCAAGAQRTSVCVALHRTIDEGWPLERAMGEALEYRHRPEKNPALRPYVERWQGAIAEALRTGKGIAWGEGAGETGETAFGNRHSAFGAE